MTNTKINGLNQSLLEFQQSLDRAVQTPEVSTEAFIAMKVGEKNWLIDLAHLAETSVPPPVSRTGRAPAWVLGIGSLRGQVHTLIDMQRILLEKPTASPGKGWATPLHPRLNTTLALIWPQMVGLKSRSELRETAVMSIEPLPWAKRFWNDEDNILWQEFDVEAFAGSAFVNLDSQVLKQ